MTGERRDSVGVAATLLDDPTEIARREAANAFRQYDAVRDLIDEVARDGRSFRLRPSTILTLHKLALEMKGPLHRCLAAQLASTLTQAGRTDRATGEERMLH